jgi:hypothetical protein
MLFIILMAFVKLRENYGAEELPIHIWVSTEMKGFQKRTKGHPCIRSSKKTIQEFIPKDKASRYVQFLQGGDLPKSSNYYHVLWVSKGQRVSKCSFLRDRSIPLPDLVLNLTKVTYMDNFAQIV